MESLLIWMILLAIPSAVGGASYLACRKAQGLSDSAFYLVMVGGGLLILLGVAMALLGWILILAGYLSCTLGGRVHAKAVDTVPDAWISGRFLIYSSTILSLTLGLVALLTVGILINYGFIRNFPAIDILSLQGLLYLISLVVTPGLMPFLIWMRQSSVLLPGVDKHFED